MHTARHIDKKLIGSYIVAIVLILAIQRCLLATDSDVPRESYNDPSFSQARTTAQVTPQKRGEDKFECSPAQTLSPFPWDSGSDATPMLWGNPAAGVFYYPGDEGYGDPNQGQYMTPTEVNREGCRPATSGH